MWYLLVLQSVTMHSSNVQAGWTNLGQFQNQRACVKASEELTAASSQHKEAGWYVPKSGAVKFVCIKDMV